MIPKVWKKSFRRLVHLTFAGAQLETAIALNNGNQNERASSKLYINK